jgi:hypothetical protein
MYSDQAPAAEAGTGARAESRGARDRAPEVKASSSGVCAKRARVSVRWDTSSSSRRTDREVRNGGGPGPPPRHFRPPVAAGRSGRWAAAMAIARGGEGRGGKGKAAAAAGLAAAESVGQGVVGPATPSALAQLSRMASSAPRRSGPA